MRITLMTMMMTMTTTMTMTMTMIMMVIKTFATISAYTLIESLSDSIDLCFKTIFVRLFVYPSIIFLLFIVGGGRGGGPIKFVGSSSVVEIAASKVK